MAGVSKNDKCFINMTNREKYHFDDFTLANYRRLVQMAVDKGFQFILHKDEFVPERKDVIWRHDVEFEPDIALKMAKIAVTIIFSQRTLLIHSVKLLN